MLETTLVFLDNGNQVLLGRLDSDGGFGEGKLNGPGGKLKEGETKEEAAVRETEEEIGVTPLDLEYRGMVRFRHTGKNAASSQDCHIFISRRWLGEPVPLERFKEVDWFDKNNLPFPSMWKADITWLPIVLGKGQFSATFNYDENYQIIEMDISEKIG